MRNLPRLPASGDKSRARRGEGAGGRGWARANGWGLLSARDDWEVSTHREGLFEVRFSQMCRGERESVEGGERGMVVGGPGGGVVHGFGWRMGLVRSGWVERGCYSSGGRWEGWVFVL